jgi:hypothetical protein
MGFTRILHPRHALVWTIDAIKALCLGREVEVVSSRACRVGALLVLDVDYALQFSFSVEFCCKLKDFYTTRRFTRCWPCWLGRRQGRAVQGHAGRGRRGVHGAGERRGPCSLPMAYLSSGAACLAAVVESRTSELGCLNLPGNWPCTFSATP